MNGTQLAVEDQALDRARADVENLRRVRDAVQHAPVERGELRGHAASTSAGSGTRVAAGGGDVASARSTKYAACSRGSRRSRRASAANCSSVRSGNSIHKRGITPTRCGPPWDELKPSIRMSSG